MFLIVIYKKMPPVRRQNISWRTRKQVEFTIFNNKIEEEPITLFGGKHIDTFLSQIYQHGRREQNSRSAMDKSIDFGTISTICQYCNGLRFRLEPTELCCVNEKVEVPQQKRPPESLN